MRALSALRELWRETCRRSAGRTALIRASDGRTWRFEDLQAMAAAIELDGAPIVVCHSLDAAGLLARFIASVQQGRAFLAFDRGIGEAERETIAARLGSAALPAGTALLKLTSGSTGDPKGIALTDAQLIAGARNILESMAIVRDDLSLAAISLAHSYGFDNLVLPLIVQGIPMVVLDTFYPRAALDAIARYRPTIVPLVPFMYTSLIGLPGDWSSVRTCISAGAMLPREVAVRFHESSGRKIHSFYGSSECGGIAYDRSDAPVLPPGCVGTPMAGVRIDMSDDGRVRVSSEAVALGYVPDEGESVLGNGRFLTGDLARLDDEGRLTLTGRSGEVLNVAGKKVHPSEIETCLMSHPGVSATAVVGLPDPKRGDAIGALVVGEGIDAAQLLAHCRTRLDPWKVPRLVKLTKSLPYDDRGKVSKEAVRARLAAADS